MRIGGRWWLGLVALVMAGGCAEVGTPGGGAGQVGATPPVVFSDATTAWDAGSAVADGLASDDASAAADGVVTPPPADVPVGTEDVDETPATATITVDPMDHVFSYISPMESPMIRQVSIGNVGGAPLKISAISLAPGSSPDFSIILVPPLPKTVEPGDQTMTRVMFSEGDGGGATLLIESNDPLQPVVEVLFSSYMKASVGPGPVAESCAAIAPSALSFGNVERGTTKTLGATLSNCSTTETLVLSDITRSNFLFSALSEEMQVDPMPTLPQSIPPGGTLPIGVTYAPLLAGPDSGYFAFHTNDASEPELHLDVSGYGTEPPVESLGLRIRLSWDADQCDVDSHLLLPGGTPAATFFDCDDDCHYGNPSPDWGVAGDWQDDPFLDVDDVDGYGPEHINISEPQPGTYTFMVHYYDDTYDFSGSTSTNATVEVISYGSVIATFGPVLLDQTNRTWDVFQVTWPSMAITELGNTYMVPASAVNACFPFPWP